MKGVPNRRLYFEGDPSNSQIVEKCPRCGKRIYRLAMTQEEWNQVLKQYEVKDLWKWHLCSQCKEEINA